MERTALISGAARGIGLETALFLAADVSSEEDLRRAASFTSEQFGSLSLLVNNAAIRASASPMELSLSAWERVLAVNLTGPFLMSRAFAPLLAESAGSIVNICSIRALMSEAGTEAYSASKGGLLSEAGFVTGQNFIVDGGMTRRMIYVE